MLADVACSDDMWKPTRWKFDWEKMLTRFSIPWSFICRSLDRILGKPHWSPTIAFHSGQNLTLGFREGRKDDYPAAGFLVVFRWRTNYYLHGQPLQWFLWAFDILVKRQNATILGTFDPANPPSPNITCLLALSCGGHNAPLAHAERCLPCFSQCKKCSVASHTSLYSRNAGNSFISSLVHCN